MDKLRDQAGAGSDVAFLVGAGRSGTTLLYKLLSLHPEIAYISNHENRLGRFLPRFLPRLIRPSIELKLSAWFARGNAYLVRRSWPKKLVPAPVEGENVYAACGIAATNTGPNVQLEIVRNRLARRFCKIRTQSGAKILLSKRTANNRRILQLKSIFPEARYIHLIRDGRDVAFSLSRVDWWSDHVLYWDGRRASEVEYAGEPRAILCARNWVHEMADIEKGLSAIDKARVHELRYEDLLQDPVGQLGELLRFLGLSMAGDYRHAVESLRLSLRPAAWVDVWSHEETNSVLTEQRPLLQKLGYIQ